MTKRMIRWILKIASAIVCFLLIFNYIQPFFVVSFIGETGSSVKGYSYLTDNSLDVVVFGPSQAFCGIDAGRLTNEYGIETYDFCANGQAFSMMPYYLREAIKTQKPKIVLIEVSKILRGNDEIEDNHLAWTYLPPGFSVEKLSSIYSVTDGNFKKTFEYGCAPLLLYHDNWYNIKKDEIERVLNPKKFVDTETRGFMKRNESTEVSFVYDNNDNTQKTVPQENVSAINEIVEICKVNQIKPVFIKVPFSRWTKGESNSVKQFMKDYKLEYLEMNDCLDDIQFDYKSDFYDSDHLNTKGARKFTDYLSGYITKYLKEVA